MKIYQSRSFAQKVKKLKKTKKTALDTEIKKIIAQPEIGIEKKGDLRGVFVYKFKIKSTQHLLAYRLTETSLELIMLGPHENYYRDLKKYLKLKPVYQASHPVPRPIALYFRRYTIIDMQINGVEINGGTLFLQVLSSFYTGV